MGSANGCCRDPKVDNVTTISTRTTNARSTTNDTATASAAIKVPQTSAADIQKDAGESSSAIGKVNESFQPDDPDTPPPLPNSEPPIEQTVVDIVENENQGELDRDLEDEGIESVYDALDDGSSDQNEFENLDYNTFQTVEDVEEQDIQEVSMSGIGALQIQKPAPQFAGTAVVDGQFKDIKLSDYKGKYVIFFFYPLDFTFVCPTEIIAFSEAAEKFREIGCEVIAASTDSHFSHLAWVNTPRKQGGLGEMKIPLLADKTGEIAKKYGVYKEDEGIAFRGLFIIDDKQNLRQITINDLPVGRSVEETLRLVQAFQFTDVHGEVCPAGWKPGDKTIKPGVNESKAFFESS